MSASFRRKSRSIRCLPRARTSTPLAASRVCRDAGSLIAVNWVLDRTGLADRAAEPIKQFSGGMRRRLNIACGIVHRPRIVLLDEPTVGVDPQSRDRIYDVLADLRSAGVSLLLTTHHLEEAEARCSRTVIIDHGKVIASGTLPELVDRTVGRHRLVTLRVDAPLAAEHAGIIEIDSADSRLGRVRLTDVGAELPPLLDRAAPGRPFGRGSRRPRSEPPGGLHPPDWKGAERVMLTLMRIAATNLTRDRVAQALTFLLPIIFFSIFATVFGRQGSPETTRIRVAVVDEDQSELSRRVVEGLRKESGLRVRTAPEDEKAAPPLDRAGGRAVGAQRRCPDRCRDPTRVG